MQFIQNTNIIICYVNWYSKYAKFKHFLIFQIEEWYERAKKMDAMSEQVNELFQRLTYSANRELVHDLYPYVWDIRCVVSLLNFYVKWLGIYFNIYWFSIF